MSPPSPLPARFDELESFAEAWALEQPEARLRKRMQSSMAGVEAFYQAVLPHLEAALLYLDEFEFGRLPPPEKRLHWLTRLQFVENNKFLPKDLQLMTERQD